MFVILTYDVKASRVNKTMKYCRQYLNHVQNSVFEGNLTTGKLRQLQKGLMGILAPKEDSCTIYIMESTRYCRKECFGISFHQKDIL